MRTKIFSSFAVAILVAIVCLIFSACGTGGTDIDLTTMSSTMVYSQVSNMLNKPSDYKGKVVKAKGTCGIYSNSQTGKKYYAVIIKDATACCSQGLEFVLKDGKYPSKGEKITVEGTFTTYREKGNTYCQLNYAKLV